ncbi:MAG: hypothetical protein RBT34_05395 [Anaerolineaceae bacterium]|jgi:hypothetical protein|nr:hypothetical protein [Anaerolineaceae bacterium]
MKRIDLQLPYQRKIDSENPHKEVLALQGISWPQQCACCQESIAGETHTLEHKVSMADNKEAVIRWQVPYCASCQEHARNAVRLSTPALVLGFVLFIVLGYILFINGYVEENPLGYGIAFGLVIAVTLISYGVYRLTRKQTAENKMKETCSHHAWTVTVPQHTLMEGEQIELVFIFDSDAYGEEFAALNTGFWPKADNFPQI